MTSSRPPQAISFLIKNGKAGSKTSCKSERSRRNSTMSAGGKGGSTSINLLKQNGNLSDADSIDSITSLDEFGRKLKKSYSQDDESRFSMFINAGKIVRTNFNRVQRIKQLRNGKD